MLSKQELWERMPVLRFEDWGLYNRDGEWKWEKREQDSSTEEE